MDAFGQAILIIFVIIRILIAAGLVYLIVFEVRRFKKRYVKKDEENDKHANGKETGKYTDGSAGNRNRS